MQYEQIKEHLEKYGTITSWDAWQKYGITRLAKYIQDLKENHVPLDCTEWAMNENTGRKYKVYKLIRPEQTEMFV